MSVSTQVILRKNRRGGVFRVAREHYVRDDIHCGWQACALCPASSLSGRRAALLAPPQGATRPYQILVPDASAAAGQIDVLLSLPPKHTGVLILETVLGAASREYPRATTSRLREALLPSSADAASLALFSNEHRKGLYLEKLDAESTAEYEARVIMHAAEWLGAEHWVTQKVRVGVLTDQPKSRWPAAYRASGGAVTVATVSELLQQSPFDSIADLYAHKETEDDRTPRETGHISHASYLSPSKVQAGLAAGSLLRGKFRLSAYNFLEAHVLVSDSGQKVLLYGREAQNRAIDGDVVIVRLLPKEQWRPVSDRIVETRAGEEDERADAAEEEAPTKKQKTQHSELLPTGQVVAISRRNWRPCCGTIDSRTYHANGSTALVLPVDKKIPKIRVRSRRLQNLIGKRILVVIDAWEQGSRYPSGHVVREIGENGDKGAETEVLLIENEIPTRLFSSAAMACLPGEEWRVDNHNIQSRRDLRQECIVSVDPPGCTDIDDALHCRRLPGNQLEVGIHIADVTAFVAHGSALDLEAAERGNTVYLVDRRIEMLPSLLSSNLCSLRAQIDRLAFSVLVRMDADANILDADFCRSVIHSRAAMTYEMAQNRIDAARSPSGGVKDEVDQSLLDLASLSRKLRERRKSAGALSLASPEVKFKMEEDSNDVTEVSLYEIRETNRMVEEFMLLANVTVAEKLLRHFPNCSMLRRHPRPSPEMLEPLEKAARAVGESVDPSSSAALNRSLEEIDERNRRSDPYLGTLMRILATRCMTQAVCFSSGEMDPGEYLHYGLAAPVYTHFTSPIRRYTDVVVHRLLASCLGYQALPEGLQSSQRMQAIAEVINERHRCAQYASRASVSLHTLLLFKDRQVLQDARILRVLHNGLIVLVPKFGVEGVAYLEPEDEASARLDPETMTLHLANGRTYQVLGSVRVVIQVDSVPERRDRVVFRLHE